MSAAVSQMWRTSCPVTTLINAVCFAWPATTFGREALRVTADGMHDIGLEIKCQAGLTRVARAHGTVRETAGLSGTERDEWPELIFLGGHYIFATLPAAVAMNGNLFSN